MPEILSPVGSWAALEAAVRSGADAVYLGVGDFNARRKAENFDMLSLQQAAAYCHVRGVKLYLTLNTVLQDKELAEALACAKQAAELGVDTFITADLGLARLLRDALPQIPLHASTQMTVHSPAALPLLKKMGFRRVVLSREMDSRSIADFCAAAKQIGMETELFIHGALCMCMSGQCYFSSLLGGRSGNRGLCAQPCRLPFSVPGGTGYDLSLKDLSLIDVLPELKNMGIDSFKIEGRMKRPEYVAAATASAKKRLCGEDINLLQQQLQQIFSRSGFTDGYYRNQTGPKMFGIRTKEDVQNTAAVYRELHELYRTERQSVPVTAKIKVTTESLTLSLCDGQHTVTVQEVGAEVARTKAVDKAFLQRSLEKLGGTPYVLTGFEAEIGENLAVSAAALNRLRRHAAEQLSALRAIPRLVSYHTPNLLPLEKRKTEPKLLLQFANPEQIPDTLPDTAVVILPIETDFSKIRLSVPVWAHMPRGILHNEEQYHTYLQKAKQNGLQTVFCGTLSAMELCLENGLTPFADFSFNLCNREAIKALSEAGACGAVVSFENTLVAVENLQTEIPTALPVYGHLPLMLTRNCPNRNGAGCKQCSGIAKMTDRKGETFFITCRNGFSEILNGIPLYMGDRRSEIQGCDYHLLRFTVEKPEAVSEVLRLYNAEENFPGRYTRGLYYREIQ
ncbi:MAG: U32 family peptidase [Clostridia bacterium]|nr:U32 family peptidase [Clostridia bacterium]